MITGVVNSSLCTGCGTCVAVCPKNAITMNLDKRSGLYLPTIDQSKCISCDLCTHICPGQTVDLSGLSTKFLGKPPNDVRTGTYITSCIAHSNDYGIRFNGASGGAVTALLIYALEKRMIDGALVTGMKADVPWEPRPFIARTKDEIIHAAGSKYCPVPANVALAEILKKNEGCYAIVGLPCHIHGLRKAQLQNRNLRRRIPLAFGLFCSAGRSFVGFETLLAKLNLALNEIVSIRYRGEGWPGKMKIETGDAVISIKLKDYSKFMTCYTPYRCLVCPDKTSELADISFGDAWLSNVVENEDVGKSICIIRTKHANSLFQNALKDGILSSSSLATEEFLKGIGYAGKKRKIVPRMFFLKMMGRDIPKINCSYMDWKISDIVDGLICLAVRSITRRKLSRRIYFFIRSKYRRIRYERYRKAL